MNKSNNRHAILPYFAILGLLSVFSLFLGSMASAQTAETAESNATKAESMKTLAEAYVAAHDFMGAVLVAHGDETILRSAFGMADLEHGVPNKPETRFLVGSISKMFCATLVRMLHESGELSVDDLVSKHLPDCPETWKGIRLIHLLTHRSGIPDLEDLPKYQEVVTLPTRPAKTMEIFIDEPLYFPPDTAFAYSSSGYVILAAVVERVTGRPFEELLREKVLDPLGLDNTGHGVNATILPHRARGYSYGPRGLQNAPFINMDLPIGGGELYSTVDDLCKWVKSLKRGALVDEAFGKTLLTPAPITHRRSLGMVKTLTGMELSDGQGYGYGWFVGRLHGRTCWQHGGVINGFSGTLTHFPDDDVTVVVLGNMEIYFPVLQLGIDLAAIAFDEDYELPVRREITVATDILERYLGEYEIRPGVTLRITLEGKQLQAQFTEGKVEPIFASSKKEFFYKTSTYRISFEPGAEGKVDRLLLHVDESRSLPAARIQ